MKNSIICGVGLVVALLVAPFATSAQHRDSTRQFHRASPMMKRSHSLGIPNLSSDQQKKIEALGVSFRKETLPITNVLAEKQAHLRTLQASDKADMGAINSTIDEMTQLRSQLMKKQAGHHEAVRKLLTDDQRVAFDSRGGRMQGFHHPRGKHF